MVFKMTIYIDLVLFINFAIDFNLLLALNILLKRRKKLERIIIGALFGSLSIFILFIELNSFFLFLFKLSISIIMILITFGYKNFNTFKDNLTYLYVLSIILGGGLYLINNQLGYKNTGLLFISKDYSINLILIIILTPTLLYLYLKESKKIKLNYSKYYQVDIVFDSGILKLTAFLDTGNKLVCPITKKPIILIEKKLINLKKEKIIYVPYTSLNNHNLLKCIKPKYIIINNKKIKNVLIGLSEEKFNIPGINCILNERVLI